MSVIECPDCCGQRLTPQARSVTITSASSSFADCPEKTLPEICELPVSDAVAFFGELVLDENRQFIATEALKEIRGRFGFLVNVGLNYLSLSRTAPTLSGGERQRIRLAGQIGCGLVGVLYILDEPSIGLHQKDNNQLIKTLFNLRDLGNTVIVVEHDEEAIRKADHIIDIGIHAGVNGGSIVAEGKIQSIINNKKSLTGQYLSKLKEINIPKKRRIYNKNKLLTLNKIETNNLKNLNVTFPLGNFICVTGVSGSG